MVDSLRERLQAALLGGSGTVGGVLLYQAVPDLLYRPELTVRVPNGAAFLAAIFVVGAVGGAVGHFAFIRSEVGSLVKRALIVGAGTGLGIALVGWSLTYGLRRWLFPFEPFAGMNVLWMGWLVRAVVAGPAGGVLVALAVVRHLKRLTKAGRPLTDASRT